MSFFISVLNRIFSVYKERFAVLAKFCRPIIATFCDLRNASFQGCTETKKSGGSLSVSVSI